MIPRLQHAKSIRAQRSPQRFLGNFLTASTSMYVAGCLKHKLVQERFDEAQVPSKERFVVRGSGGSHVADYCAGKSAGTVRRGCSSLTDQASTVRGHFEGQSGFRV